MLGFTPGSCREEGRRGASVNYISRGRHSIELLVKGNGFLRHPLEKSVVVVAKADLIIMFVGKLAILFNDYECLKINIRQEICKIYK